MRRSLNAVAVVVRRVKILILQVLAYVCSLQHRTNLKEFDPEALAFKPALGGMLAAIYHNPKDMAMNQDRLQKILQFWGAKEVYDMDTINTLEGEMVAGPPPPEVPTMKPSSAGKHPSHVSVSYLFCSCKC